MVVRVADLRKTIGQKELFKGVAFTLNEGEKVALIGRNGLGKTTLFRILTGDDKEYTGEIEYRKDSRVIMTQQEHILNENVSPLDYILNDLPEYRDLLAVIKDYEDNSYEDMDHIEKYTDAVMFFSDRGYYEVEDRIVQTLEKYEIPMDRTLGSMETLSGGQKRFVELTRVMYSGADLAYIDEPTNHMDYVGKAAFIEWLGQTKEALVIISHDRDVLRHVDRILEIKDGLIKSFNGNYDDYLKENGSSTVAGIHSYELSLKRIEQAKVQMIAARAHKHKAKSDKSRTAALIREQRFEREMEKLKSELDKPSFWLDQESLEQVGDETIAKYEKYKEKNISIKEAGGGSDHQKRLLSADKLSVGYKEPLFSNINLELHSQDRVEIHGRNGAGKSTLIKALIRQMIKHTDKGYLSLYRPISEHFKATDFKGDYKISPHVTFGVYEQEPEKTYLEMPLLEAVMRVYSEQEIPLNAQEAMRLLGAYLFSPKIDGEILIKNLSGGQKARFQLIRMLSNTPNLLILDEPTNHLDLPSIEELENALQAFNGAIIYITHDTYLSRKLGGVVVNI